jgi:hypothetical protein
MKLIKQIEANKQIEAGAAARTTWKTVVPNLLDILE